jgi:hypothetical protein
VGCIDAWPGSYMAATGPSSHPSLTTFPLSSHMRQPPADNQRSSTEVASMPLGAIAAPCRLSRVAKCRDCSAVGRHCLHVLLPLALDVLVSRALWDPVRVVHVLYMNLQIDRTLDCGKCMTRCQQRHTHASK